MTEKAQQAIKTSIANFSAKRTRPLVRAAPLLLTLILGLVCYGIFFRRGLGLSVIGYSLSPAERVLSGEVPYRDFLFNYTPGVLWINALFMKAFGATMIVTRAGVFAFRLLTLVLVFEVARRFVPRWVALIPVALTLAWLGQRQVFNVYPDHYLMPFMLSALLSMLSYDRSERRSWLLVSGLSAGIVLLFKHNVGLFVFLAGAVSVTAREMLVVIEACRRERITRVAVRLCAFAAGFGMVAAGLVIYLALNGALGEMLRHFVHHAADYSETRSVGLPPPRLLKSFALAALVVLVIAGILLRIAPRFLASYLGATIVLGSCVLLAPGRAYVLKDSALAAVPYFPPLLFGAALVLVAWRIRCDRQSFWRLNGPTMIVGLFAASLYLEVFPRADYYHLVRVLPLVVVFFLVLIARTFGVIERFFEARATPARLPSLLLAATPVVFLLFAGILDTWSPQFSAGFRFKDRTELRIERGRGMLVEKRQAELAGGLVRLIHENSSPADYVFSFSQRGSGIYFLSGRRNPSRLLWWSSAGIQESERDAVMKMIDEGIPKLVIIQDVPANKRLADYLSTQYYKLGVVFDIAVYDRKR